MKDKKLVKFFGSSFLYIKNERQKPVKVFGSS